MDQSTVVRKVGAALLRSARRRCRTGVGKEAENLA